MEYISPSWSNIPELVNHNVISFHLIEGCCSQRSYWTKRSCWWSYLCLLCLLCLSLFVFVLCMVSMGVLFLIVTNVFSNIYFWYLIVSTLHCCVILLFWHPLIMTLQYSDIPFFPLPTLHVQTLFHCVHSAFFFSFHYYLLHLKRDQTFAICSYYQANWKCIV